MKLAPSVFAKRSTELVEIVESIQAILWLDMDGDGEFWNRDKEWEVGTIEHVAGVLIRHGLRPEFVDRDD